VSDLHGGQPKQKILRAPELGKSQTSLNLLNGNRLFSQEPSQQPSSYKYFSELFGGNSTKELI
jgi:hypothetical protein